VGPYQLSKTEYVLSAVLCDLTNHIRGGSEGLWPIQDQLHTIRRTATQETI